MKLSMTFRDYLDILKGHSNSPLTLNRLTLPFGIISDSEASHTLLVGHILEDLAEKHTTDQPIDCIDVLASAYDLGHEKAGTFLDEAPYMISKMAKELGLTKLH